MRYKRKSTTPLITGKDMPRIRWLAWLIICALSVFFTEIVSGNTPSAFVNVYGLLVITPLFFLHIVVLLPLVFRTGKTSPKTLYFAGTLFGLYEAYITKQIWSPVDYPVDLYVGGVAVCSTLMLVLFWHPIMSLIAPLFTADGLLNSHRNLKIRLPFQWLKRQNPLFLSVILGSVMGLIHGSSMSKPGPVLFSAISSTLIIWLLIRVWKNWTGRTIFTMAQLIPTKKQWKTFVLLLAAYYLALGCALRPDAFPPFIGHVTVAAMYLIIGGLFWISRRHDSKNTIENIDLDNSTVYLKISSRNWLVFSVGFVLFSFLASFLQGWSRMGVHYVLWGLGITTGVVAFAWAVFLTLRKIEIHFKKPHFKKSDDFLNTRSLSWEKFNIFRNIRNIHFRFPRINMNWGSYFKKIVSTTKSMRTHRAQR